MEFDTERAQTLIESIQELIKGSSNLDNRVIQINLMSNEFNKSEDDGTREIDLVRVKVNKLN